MTPRLKFFHSAVLILGATAATGCGPAKSLDSQPKLTFQPSNVSLAAHDLSNLGDVSVSSDCNLSTDPGVAISCLKGPSGDPVDWVALQPDGSRVRVVVVGSLNVDQTAKLTISGGLPLVLVAMKDMTLGGKIVASAALGTAGPGGFSQNVSFLVGNGPGGGPAPIKDAGPVFGLGHVPGISAGGGSHCGLGGTGSAEVGDVTAAIPAATSGYGAEDLRPLLGGSSGGAGVFGNSGAGGGAVQLVAGGTFTLGTYGTINVGGGGGEGGGELNAEQEASGAGSGGSALVEAHAVKLLGTIAANGGGGGGQDGRGNNANDSMLSAAGGSDNSMSNGGAGSAGAGANGIAGLQSGYGHAGGGGGGAGRIRINSSSGSANLDGALTPALSTGCATQGRVLAIGTVY